MPSVPSYPLYYGTGTPNGYSQRLPTLLPPLFSPFDHNQRTGNPHFEVSPGPTGRNLEQELNAVSPSFSPSTRGAEYTKTGGNRRHASRHRSHHVAQRAEEYLDVWHEGLEALATQPGCEANKSDILDHVNTMYGWLRQDILPGIDILQAYTEGLMDGREQAERDNDTLLAQLQTVRHEYASLFEAYMREFEASREKTRNLGEAMARFEAGLKRAKGCVVDDHKNEVLELVGEGAAREWLAKGTNPTGGAWMGNDAAALT